MNWEIKNVDGFFIGLIILIIGIFIVVFDFPQIQYFDNLKEEMNNLSEEEENIHQRLKIEFLIGTIILVIGIVLCGFSFFRKTSR